MLLPALFNTGHHFHGSDSAVLAAMLHERLPLEITQEVKTSWKRQREHVDSCEQEASNSDPQNDEAVWQTLEGANDAQHEQNNGINDGCQAKGITVHIVKLALFKQCGGFIQHCQRFGEIAVNKSIHVKRRSVFLLCVSPLDCSNKLLRAVISRQRYCDNPNCQAERNNRKARAYYMRKKAET